MSSTTLFISHTNLVLQILNQMLKKDPTKPVVFSPISLIQILTILYKGSCGSTKEQLKKYLVDGIDNKELHETIDEILNKLSNLNINYLNVSNKLLYQKEIDLLASYEGILDRFNIQRSPSNFTSTNPCVIKKNNVEKSINNSTKEIVGKNDLNKQLELYFKNSVSFKNKFLKSFNKDDTKEGFFYTKINKIKKVDIMYNKRMFHYYEDNDFQVVKLNYSDHEQKMLIFLPKKKCSLLEQLSSLNGEKIYDMIHLMRSHMVKLYLPKFEFNSVCEFDKILPNIGLTLPFSNKADFSKIAKNKQLKFIKIVQEINIECKDEKQELPIPSKKKIKIHHVDRSYTSHETIEEPITVQSYKSYDQIQKKEEKNYKNYILQTRNHAIIANHPFLYMVMDNMNNTLFIGCYQ